MWHYFNQLKWSTRNIQDFSISFFPHPILYQELNMIIHTSYINIYSIIHAQLVFANFCFPCGIWSNNYLIWQGAASKDIQPRLHPTFFRHFFSFLPYFRYPLNIENDICILAFRGLHEKRVIYCFIKKWFHTILYQFKLSQYSAFLGNIYIVCTRDFVVMVESITWINLLNQ